MIATAGSLGMKTITWDVDPRDWSLPGTSEIYSNIVANTGPGSIVLMHDGGGPRDETLAALPQIIDTLRGRGLQLRDRQRAARRQDPLPALRLSARRRAWPRPVHRVQ